MFFERNHTCCFTGHRIIDPLHRPLLTALLEKAVRQRILEGYSVFAAGGALGFDTVAAETVLLLRAQFPQVRLVVVAPFAGQPDGWNRSDILRYERIRQGADDFICLGSSFTPDCMRRRNRALVEMSSLCIAYCLRPRSGASQTVAMARREGLEIVPLALELEAACRRQTGDSLLQLRCPGLLDLDPSGSFLEIV